MQILHIITPDKFCKLFVQIIFLQIFEIDDPDYLFCKFANSCRKLTNTAQLKH